MSFLRRAAQSRPTQPAPHNKESLLERSQRRSRRTASLATRARELDAAPPAASAAPQAAPTPKSPASPLQLDSRDAAEAANQVVDCADAGLRGPLAAAHLARCLGERLPSAAVVAFASAAGAGPLTPLAAIGAHRDLLRQTQIDPESAGLAPGSPLASTGAVLLTSREQHSSYAALFLGVDTAAQGQWAVLTPTDDGVATLLIAMWQSPTLALVPACSEPTESFLAALAGRLGSALSSQMTPPPRRTGAAALRQAAEADHETLAADTLRLDASSLIRTLRAELPDAIPEEILLRVQTAAATALCRLGRIVATDDGMALAPDLPLDTELVHRQVCYALRPLAAGIAGTEGAALLAMTKLTSSGDAATVSAPAS